MKRIVLIAGFESFNAGLYRQAAQLATSQCPDLDIQVFSDRALSSEPETVATALENADVFFGSLLFDYDQVLWLRERVEHIPIRLVFESALELMALTKLGKFVIGDQPKGMPKPVKFILSKFSSGREEDKLAGYISFLKTGPKLLKFVPVKKVQDLRNWLIIYGYWNAGGTENVAAMCWVLAEKYLDLKVGEIPPPLETPNMGLLHPDYQGYFESPRKYLEWYRQQKQTSPTPVVGILLYRKHVITKQPYIPQLIRKFEEAGLTPLPVFINGVEGHVAVRDWMTSAFESQKLEVRSQKFDKIQKSKVKSQKYDEIQKYDSPETGLTQINLENHRCRGECHSPSLDLKSKGKNQKYDSVKPILSLSPEAVKVDAVVSTIGFPLVGGPAGSMEAGRQVEVSQRILTAKNVPYFVAAPLLIQDIYSWTRQGVGGLQSVVLYALPELDGAIDPVPLGGLVGEDIYLIPERVKRLTSRVKNWIKLRQTPPAERKIAVILYGFPPGYGATGTAALLNVPRSLLKFLHALKEEGYNVGEIPEDGEELIRQIKEADEIYSSSSSSSPLSKGETRGERNQVNLKSLEKWLGYLSITRMEKQWGNLTRTGIKTDGENFHIGGIQLGNIWLGVQPPLGISGDPMRLMFERNLTPHPQYAAFYKWLQNEFQADAIVHFGMHGTVEWLPGSPLGNTGYSWSDILLGNMPHLYIYAANNPSESMLAKRRGYGVLISHNIPPYSRAGLYKELVSLRELIYEYREDPQKNSGLRESIFKKIFDTGLNSDCPFEYGKKLGIEFTAENVRMFSADVVNPYFIEIYEYLQVLEQRLFSSGLHTLGEVPNEEELKSYLEAYFGEKDTDFGHGYTDDGVKKDAKNMRDLLMRNADKLDTDFGHGYTDDGVKKDAANIRDLLMQNTDELTNLLRGLNGEYIPAAPGGDLLRDGVGVLPTGRNIHALDPYRMPSPAAYERGREIARKIITQHLEENNNYPETVAVMLWGLDAIKTRGESIGFLLELVGAEPVKEGTGRIVRYELKNLAEVGHPRIDILGNLSGIFRDSFVNIIELLDDLFQRAATADEPVEQNFIRKHALALQAQGVENISARLFSNPAGDFGSLVNDRVVDSNWESADELGDTWQGRNVFSYGRKDKGEARPEILQELLKGCDRIVQEIDSVEYGLTDIQEYYANTGGLKLAAEKQRGKKVSASFVESFSKDTTPRKLEDLLRMEYRTKLLNPKWAEAMANQGSGGAYEISQRMTALIGWGGTANFADNWVYDGAAETYALDAEMARKLREANPEAFRNIIGRMLEANGRGFWQTDEEKLQKLRELYEVADEEIEGVSSNK
ncbi:MAG: magnesium chelatase subunit H [Okeania sp. SIO2G4]|uniref:magnesium chelatase subunit H n=1 Tax=unclassified Okeania TaxID=2634635 RepID=UPI0013B90862|nr:MULTISPECIES: magnesium chelatase subunit H [unclassified Okeania]NEP39489.1 magnesium chelatase subunit H [Okeania sp. SIO2H7]NEP70520.1 magnesium chelatase subunit H [Okeania sp. SIO2G5]NEP92751.1 magnesium chelatase subunit H [Okeania sp. SIO2F5]NEQ90320.1 magnesium chelatase subunit H [Okeania sp. SIO2G4]